MEQVKQKLHVVLFYQSQPQEAKEIAKKMQLEGYNTLLIDVNAWYPDEDLNAKRAIVLPDVEEFWHRRINKEFERVELYADLHKKDESTETTAKTPPRVIVPEDWRDMGWTEVRLIAQEVKGSPVKNKAEAWQIIEAYLKE